MKYKPYHEKLKDPRWQKRRLEILSRANFICEWCQGKEDELHVHHVYYLRKKDPWDYPDSAYLCLCKNCHENYQLETMVLLQEISETPVDFIPWSLFPAFLSLNDPRVKTKERFNSLIEILVNCDLFGSDGKRICVEEIISKALGDCEKHMRKDGIWCE